MSASGWSYFDCYVVRETDQALLLRIRRSDTAGVRGEFLAEKWVPLSVIADSDEYSKGVDGSVAIKDWWCEKNGLEV